MNKVHVRYLRDELARRVARNPRYSLRAFALFLNVDPGTLSGILAGKKNVSADFCRNLFEKLNMSPQEKENFISSVVAHEAIKLRERIVRHCGLDHNSGA